MNSIGFFSFILHIIISVYVSIILFIILTHIFDMLQNNNEVPKTTRFAFIFLIYLLTPLFYSLVFVIGWAKFNGVDYFAHQPYEYPIALLLTIYISVTLVSLARIAGSKSKLIISNFLITQMIVILILFIYLTIFKFFTPNDWLVAVDNILKMFERDTSFSAVIAAFVAFTATELFLRVANR